MYTYSGNRNIFSLHIQAKASNYWYLITPFRPPLLNLHSILNLLPSPTLSQFSFSPSYYTLSRTLSLPLHTHRARTVKSHHPPIMGWVVHYGARVEGARGEVPRSKRHSFIQSVVDPGGCCMCKDELENRGRRDAAHYPLLCLFSLLQLSHCYMVRILPDSC